MSLRALLDSATLSEFQQNSEFATVFCQQLAINEPGRWAGLQRLESHPDLPAVRSLIRSRFGASEGYIDRGTVHRTVDYICAGAATLTRDTALDLDLSEVRRRLETGQSSAVHSLAGIALTTPDSPSRWAKVFACSLTTLKRRFKDKAIRHKKLSSKSYQIAIDDLPASHQERFRKAGNPSPK